MSAATLTAAPSGGPGLGAYLDSLARTEDALLNVTGRAFKAICSLWSERPAERHITAREVATRARCAEKSARRAIDALAALGKLRHVPDPSHPVGWAIVPPDTDVPPGQECPATPDISVHPSYVVREGFNSQHVGRRGGDTDVPPGQNCPPPPAPAEPLTRTLGRLEGDPSALDRCVARLNREFGEDFEPFHRRTCGRVVAGTLAVGDLIGAVEEADRPGVRNRGAAFTASVKRRLEAPPAAPAPIPAPAVAPEPPPVAVEPAATRPAPEATPATVGPAPAPADWAALAAEFPDNHHFRRMADRAASRAEAGRPPRLPSVVEVEAPRVEVCPTDDEVRAAVDLMGASCPAMRMAAAQSLCDWGRPDLVSRKLQAAMRTGREALSSLPAGPRSPRQTPG